MSNTFVIRVDEKQARILHAIMAHSDLGLKGHDGDYAELVASEGSLFTRDMEISAQDVENVCSDLFFRISAALDKVKGMEYTV